MKCYSDYTREERAWLIVHDWPTYKALIDAEPERYLDLLDGMAVAKGRARNPAYDKAA